MERTHFLYLRDPLFEACLIGYALNRFVLKPLIHGGFVHTSFNDLICIPFWVPIMLWGLKLCRLRPVDSPPQWHEVLVPLLMWSYVFEVLLPSLSRFRGKATADPADVMWYAIGAFVASVYWRWRYDGQRRNTEAAKTGTNL